MNNKTIAIFDFDQTLYMCPLPTPENREKLSKAIDYTRSGWWGRGESLNLDVFDILPNPHIKSQYDIHSEIGNKRFMLTGRIFRLKEAVRNVFRKDGFSFDGEYYADGRRTIDYKLAIIDELVETHNPSTIYFYDDREEHIQEFRTKGDELKDTKGIDFYQYQVFIDGSGIIEVPYGQKGVVE